MIESSVLMSTPPLSGVGAPATQTLPPPQSQDVMRFDDLMSGQLDLSSIKSNTNDQAVLQVVEPNTGVESTSLKDMVINKLANMDDSYSSLLNQLKDRPQFSSYLSDAGVQGSDSSVRTYPDVGSVNTTETDNYQTALQDMHKTQEAALNYQKDTTAWTFNAQMWSTTINLASAMVNQVAQGFKTLFRASG
ncbi:hypothetical protein [Thiofilum flexile]|uniref:hypothetical protein n=1 Tax=Thiofilum flexile TaxID=125627 RepID=UPI00037F4867|nr:hypothetical protein [Thiofilum flexile]